MVIETVEETGLTWLTSPLLKGVRHGFSTRLGGVSPAPWDSLNLRLEQGDGREAMLENYRRLCGALDIMEGCSVLSAQVHECTVRICTSSDAGKGLFRDRNYTADALVTQEADLPLFVFSADCGTVLLYDPDGGAVGAVHAGWRGCAGGIIEKTIKVMEAEFGVQPEHLLAALGPCIGKCCFETDGDVPAAMWTALGADAAPYLERRGKKYHVDLAGLNRVWLLRSGVPAKNIDVCGMCTACRPDLFWSHRRMGEERGLQCAVIAASPEDCL